MNERRATSVGVPMLVRLPSAEEREVLQYRDTGEGGLAFFILIPELPIDERRQVCLAGGGYWPTQDVSFPRMGPMGLDGFLLIGSTGESLLSEELGEYFQVTEDRLTKDGQKLLSILRALYGDKGVEFVTLLDT